MKKILIFILTLCMLLGNHTQVLAESQYNTIYESDSLVTFKPVKKVYINELTDKEFTPSKQVKKDAEKIYKKMKANKQVKIRYKDTDKNAYYWGKVYSYINITYFPYEHFQFKDAYTEYDDMVDVIGKNEYKRTIKANKDIQKSIQNIIKEAGIDTTTTQKEAVSKLYEWFRQNCRYNLDSSGNIDGTSYHMLLYKEGVCFDYSCAFKHICDFLGIQCGVVSDYTLNHAYNIVLLDGVKYYTDITWNRTNDWVLITEDELFARGRHIDRIKWHL